MNKSIFSTFMWACLMVISLASCKKDKDPANIIDDSAGLDANLTWTMSDGSNPLMGADLDLYIYNGNTTASTLIRSGETLNFEELAFETTLPDGDYWVMIDYFDLDKDGSWTLTFTGQSSGKSYSIANRNFTTAEDSNDNWVLKINKSGNRFTFTNL